MALVRWTRQNDLAPWSALRDLEGTFGRMFGELTREHLVNESCWAPAVDLRETDEAYTLEADLPGIKKEDIEVVAVDNTVTLKGERKDTREARADGIHRFERRYGCFQRTFELPAGFKADEVAAKYEDGVLRVTLPKKEEAKPRQIEVKVH